MGFEPRILRPDDETPEGDRAGHDAADSERRLLTDRASAARGRDHATPARGRSARNPTAAPAEELELPADLEELAAQLSADAALLEARYPSKSVRGGDSDPAWRQMLRVTAAAVFLVGSVLWVSHWRARGEGQGAGGDDARGALVGHQVAASSDRDAHRAGAARGDALTSLVAKEVEDVRPTFTIESTDGPTAFGATGGNSPENGETGPAGALAGGSTAGGSTAGGSARPPACCATPSALRLAAIRGDATRDGSNSTPNPRPAGQPGELLAFKVSDDARSEERRVDAPRDRLGMLETQVAAFKQVIDKLQAEVWRRDQLLKESNELIRSLSAEVAELRGQATSRAAASPQSANDAPTGDAPAGGAPTGEVVNADAAARDARLGDAPQPGK